MILLAAVFILIIHISANNMEFSRYNVGWNGTSSFFSDLDRHRCVEISDPDKLAGYPRNTTLLIIAPYRHPAAGELTAYRAFLQGGNTIFLADDFGTGNEILDGIGSSIKILPGNLSSLDRSNADPYSVIAYHSAEKSPVTLPEDIALNRAAPLDGGSPLMLTSVMSWSDGNGDRRLNTGENMGTFPVMTLDSIGSGQLIVLSDPSIFINSMYSPAENENNRFLIRNIVAGDNSVLIDQMNSRTGNADGVGEIFHVIRNTVNIEIFILCLLMLGMAWAWKKKII
ncbi:MAG: hypothetical protein CVV30_04345 [Methanomicrobiales archaeon HGW-Methanomicrobiales-1]|nr:MAG: hypothetical protein CVV30_04345 [Methanomicrobiales archaeon HGW-Methanomicrobiales-1]